MTKADRIRKLYADGFLTVKEIAALVGCRPEYVRVAARQRAGGKKSASDHKYWQRVAEKGDRELARSFSRREYHRLRGKGASVRDARNRSGAAYKAIMQETARHG